MKALILMVMLGHSADVSTSLVAFHNGAHEMNPLILSERPVPFIAQAVVFSGVEAVLLHKLAKHHPTAARRLAWIQFSCSMGAATNNTIVIHRLYQQRR